MDDTSKQIWHAALGRCLTTYCFSRSGKQHAAGAYLGRSKITRPFSTGITLPSSAYEPTRIITGNHAQQTWAR
jgi:hypothetical protein